MSNARDELRIKLLQLGGTISSCWPDRGGKFDQKKAEAAVDATVDAILAAGYRKPRTITTAEEIQDLPALTIVVYDDMANGGLLQTYVVPDDGTVMFKDRHPFHLMTFAGDYINAEDMPLPLTAVYEVGA